MSVAPGPRACYHCPNGDTRRGRDVGSAVERLLAIARSDTGQSRRVADFLLAWWNGQDLGHFPIEHIWNVDRAISADMVAILDYLAQQPCAVYANAFGFDGEMTELVRSWRPVHDEPSTDTISQAGVSR